MSLFLGGMSIAGNVSSMADLQKHVQQVASTATAATVALVSDGGETGSGVIVTSRGLILTAAHVVGGDEIMRVVFADGRVVKGRVLGANFTRDAAMVQIMDEGNYPHVELGKSDELHVGDFVVALGHSKGFDPERRAPIRLGRLCTDGRQRFLISECTLIGGDSGVHRYSAADWDGMTALIRGLSRTYGVRWRVSNSRRTPRAVADVLSRMLAAGEIAEFVDVKTAGPGTMVPLLEADVIVVTEDSSSMLSDALAARRPVVALKPARVKPGLANEMVAALAALHEVAVLPMQDTSPDLFARAVSELVVSETDPRDALAEEVLGRFFPERLNAGA